MNFSGPGDQVEFPRHENAQTKGYAIPGENREVVCADVAQQAANGPESGNEGGQKADNPHAEVVHREQGTFLIKLIYRRAK